MKMPYRVHRVQAREVHDREQPGPRPIIFRACLVKKKESVGMPKARFMKDAV